MRTPASTRWSPRGPRWSRPPANGGPGTGDSYTLRLTSSPTKNVDVALVTDGQTDIVAAPGIAYKSVGGLHRSSSSRATFRSTAPASAGPLGPNWEARPRTVSRSACGFPDLQQRVAGHRGQDPLDLGGRQDLHAGHLQRRRGPQRRDRLAACRGRYLQRLRAVHGREQGFPPLRRRRRGDRRQHRHAQQRRQVPR